MRGRATVAIVTVALLLIGCGREDAGRADVQPGAQARDSAGVRIVDNGPLGDATWQIGAEPLFTTGWDDQGPQFTWPQSGRILPDGGALIGEYSEGAVYRLGPDGWVLETWGRKGEGPGEYQRLDAILLFGDSTVVSDGGLRRVTVRAPDGSVRTAPLPSSHVLPVVAGVWSDGRLLLVGGEGYGGVGETRPEWVFQTQPIVVADAMGEAVDTIADLPHWRRWYGTPGASPGAVHVKGRSGGTTDGFAWARSDRSAVHWYDDAGRLLQIARWDEAPAPLGAAFRDEIRGFLEEAYAGRDPEFVRAQLTRIDEDLDRHEGPLPYWDRLHVDREGNVWLSQYPPLGQSPERWRVIRRDGSAAGWVDIPGVLAVLDITENRILAVVQNELDVSAVVMLQLHKQ